MLNLDLRYCCEVCEKKEPYLEHAHIIPKALGGGRDRENTMLVCPNCHKKFDYGIFKSQEIRAIEGKLISLTKSPKWKNNMDVLSFLYFHLGLKNDVPKQIVTLKKREINI